MACGESDELRNQTYENAPGVTVRIPNTNDVLRIILVRLEQMERRIIASEKQEQERLTAVRTMQRELSKLAR